MWEPARLTTLCASTDCYRDSLTPPLSLSSKYNINTRSRRYEFYPELLSAHHLAHQSKSPNLAVVIAVMRYSSTVHSPTFYFCCVSELFSVTAGMIYCFIGGHHVLCITALASLRLSAKEVVESR